MLIRFLAIIAFIVFSSLCIIVSNKEDKADRTGMYFGIMASGAIAAVLLIIDTMIKSRG